MKIELLKTESDWAQTSLGCYISVNNSLLDVITPLNNPHELTTIEIPHQGVLRVVIRDMGRSDGYLGSVSVPITLLNPSSSPLILPLFDSPANDTLSHIADSIQIPRITLAIYNDFSDDEIFLSRTEITSENNTEIVMASKISISKEPEEMFIKTSNFNLAQDDNKRSEVIEVLQVEIESYKEEIMKERERNKALQQNCSNFMNTLRVNSERAQVRENSLLDLMNEKEEKINRSIEINMELQGTVRKLEYENKQMKEKAEQLEAQEKYVKSLENELKKYQEMLRAAEKSRDELTTTLVECSQIDGLEDSLILRRTPMKDFSSKKFGSPQIRSAEKNEKVLEDKLNFFEDKELGAALNQSAEMNDSYMKKIIQKSIGKDLVLNKIERIRECLYRVNGVEMSLAICDDGIYVKNGNTLVTLAEFWNCEGYPHADLKSSAWLDKGMENEWRQPSQKPPASRPTMKPSHSPSLKSKTMSLSKNLISILHKNASKSPILQ